MSTHSRKASNLATINRPSIDEHAVALHTEWHHASQSTGTYQDEGHHQDDCQGRKVNKDFCLFLKSIKDKTIVRMNRERYVVYFDDSFNLRWELHPDIKDEINSYACMMDIERIAALPIDYLSEKHRLAWGKMLAHAISLATLKKKKDAAKIAKTAKDFVKARAREKARFWWVEASVGASFVLLAAYIAAAYNLPEDLNKTWLGMFNHKELFLIGTTIIFGVIGSQFSILERLGKIEVDPSAGRAVYWGDAIIRILTGAFAAIIGYAALKSEFVLGFISNGITLGVGDSNQYLWVMAFIAMLSGFSERFIPSLLQKTEGQVTDDNGNGNAAAVVKTNNATTDKTPTDTDVALIDSSEDANTYTDALDSSASRETELEGEYTSDEGLESISKSQSLNR